MQYESLILEKEGQIALVTLNRPEKLNAISKNLHLELLQMCDELQNDDAIRVVIWTGSGRGFCSGADLTEVKELKNELPKRQERLDDIGWIGRQALAISRQLDKPTIAAVNGIAVGAGMSLALACDLRVGSEKSSFKTIFIERHLSPDSGMSYFLPRIVGMSRAFDLLFTSRTIGSKEAYRIGLLDRLTTSGKLVEEAKNLAKQIAFWPPVAMQISKRILQQSMESYLSEQLRNESHGLILAQRAPHDVKEAKISFDKKRPPRFTGY